MKATPKNGRRVGYETKCERPKKEVCAYYYPSLGKPPGCIYYYEGTPNTYQPGFVIQHGLQRGGDWPSRTFALLIVGKMGMQREWLGVVVCGQVAYLYYVKWDHACCFMASSSLGSFLHIDRLMVWPGRLRAKQSPEQL